MADPKTEKPDPKGQGTAPDELAAARSRIAELEKIVTQQRENAEALEKSFRADWEEREKRFRSDWEERDKAFQAAHEQMVGEAARTRGGPRLKGAVLNLRAKYALRYVDAKSAPQRVAGGKEFRATIEELADDGLVEGDAFEVIGG